MSTESERKEARTKCRAERKLAAKLQQASIEPEDKQENATAVGRRCSFLPNRKETHGRLSVVSSTDEEVEEEDRSVEYRSFLLQKEHPLC